MATVQFRGTRADVTRIAVQLAAILSGRQADTQDIAKGFLNTLGFAALTDIKDAYELKADGGTDEMGIKWDRLSKEYLAYGRRFGPGEQKKLKGSAGLGKGHRTAPGDKKGLLTTQQLKQWRQIYSQVLRRFQLSLGESEAKSRAAAIAWVVMKKRGAKTKLEVFGNRQVQILRDTGVLLNSLGPGLLSGASYSPPQDQVFQVLPGEVIVGTNVAYAGSHQRGDTKRGIPARPFLPDDKHPVPDVWWQRWVVLANKALAAGAEMLYRRGP
jgi:hypothetical protein